jgi:hypothetical protein
MLGRWGAYHGNEEDDRETPYTGPISDNGQIRKKTSRANQKEVMKSQYERKKEDR